jgi:hypothetical protein
MLYKGQMSYLACFCSVAILRYNQRLSLKRIRCHFALILPIAFTFMANKKAWN